MTPPPSQASIRLSPHLDELPRLVAFIEAFAEQQALPAADTFALTLAAEELFANTLRHSHPPATWAAFALHLQDDRIAALYSDDGAAFDPTAQHAPDTTLPAEDRAIGGLGIEIIRKTMQDLQYSRHQTGNRLQFARKRSA